MTPGNTARAALLALLHAAASITIVAAFAHVAIGRTRFPDVPIIEGPAVQITGNPDLGALTTPNQQPVDFAIWQAADKTWQVLECIRNTREPGHTRILFRFEGGSLTTGNWQPMGVAMRSNPIVGETPGGLQAPYVWREGRTFYMTYGDWNHICLAISSDGKNFTRVIQANGQTGLFGEGDDANTRDPMVLKLARRYYCYYAANPGDQCSDFCRTSVDLKSWSDAVQVAFGGSAGTGRVSAECPFVIEPAPGQFYLFRTQSYDPNPQTSVYYSNDPLDFGLDDDAQHFVCTLPIAAPEIVIDHGQYYIASLLPTLQGIEVAKLGWRVEK